MTETSGGRTRLDTDDGDNNSIHAGYATYDVDPATGTATAVNPALPSLDRTIGFTVDLHMRVLSEDHANNDRSGVSLITISDESDGQTLGIELAFWENQVWAQNEDFTHGEEAAFDTTLARAYELFVQGTTYVLSVDELPVLTGPLRDYSSMPTPYQLPNFIFVGDDTTSARGDFEFSRLAVVPEPGAGLIALAGVLLGLGRRRSK